MSNPSPQKRSIKNDYLSGAASLQPFYQYPLTDIPFEQIIQDKSSDFTDRNVLVSVLMEQYSRVDYSRKTLENIQRLADKNAFTVTTGHQIVLFGGPLFTFYKVLNVIRLCEELKVKHPKNEFVPIFWIHTEDHDFEEMNHFYSSFEEKQVYQESFQSATGHHVLQDSIESLIPVHFSEALKKAYTPDKKMSQAYFEFMNELFKDYGLVILNADHARLKTVFNKSLLGELKFQWVKPLVEQASEGLEKAGYPAQINAREINLFYLDPQGRNRIVKEGKVYKLVDRAEVFTEGEMIDLLELHPERFSPNVSLRPLYQEMILPNLAYVGGWGELSYWMQLKRVFDAAEVNFPLLLPRFSATIFKENQLEEWQEMDFAQTDIQKSLHELYAQYMPNLWEEKELEAIEAKMNAVWDELGEYMGGFMPTMSRSADAQKTKSQKFFQNTAKKIQRVIRNTQREPFLQIEKLKNQIQPDRIVQERVLSLASFPAHSPHEFIAMLYKEVAGINLVHHYIRMSETMPKVNS